MIARATIACLGAGRMGRGIAVAFAYAGHPTIMIDVKPRSTEAFATLEADALGEISKTLASLARFGLLTEDDAKTITARVSVEPANGMTAALASAGIVFEGVPEVVDLKRDVLATASKCIGPEIVIASPRQPFWSTISPRGRNPAVFNVHFNPPIDSLVEISPGAALTPTSSRRSWRCSSRTGKVPVVRRHARFYRAAIGRCHE